MGIKQIAIAAVVIVILGAMGASYKFTYNAGWNGAVLEHQDLATEAQNRAIEAARREWEITAEAARQTIEDESSITEEIRNVDREIPGVNTPDCVDLGADFLRVFNAAVSASNDGKDNSTETAAEPD
jgi:uncharacterized membrane protein